ncbi:hypothetical protein HY732_05170 [Candidatus Uhrbacteria bacterium]|nr:hypothetical protein [Candidatus Uhrbacteria bacterium]
MLGRHTADEIRAGLHVIEERGVSDKETFVADVLDLFQPILDLFVTHPQEFEIIQRDIFLARGGFTPINEILSYGMYKGGIHIHLAPSITIEDKIELIKSGLCELAKRVEADDKIKEISATSWIVEKYPRVMRSLGFDNFEGVDEATRHRYYEHEKRPIAKATMTREKLLTMYGTDISNRENKPRS